MTFERNRLLIKISIVFLWILLVLDILAGLIVGIVLESSPFNKELNIPFIFIGVASGIAAALIDFLVIKLIKWLLLDFEELDARLNSIEYQLKQAKADTESHLSSPQTNDSFVKGDLVKTITNIGEAVPQNTPGIVVYVESPDRIQVEFDINATESTCIFVNSNQISKK